MIKFFRKIRSKLLKENQLSRYFFYAIGEILLVVIGILLALQFNNWNKSKNERNEEIKTLLFFRDCLEQDTANLNIHRFWLNNIQFGISKSITELGKENPTDSLGGFLNLALNESEFKINKAPYESLKANGPNQISNDSLRNIIIDAYENRLIYFENVSNRQQIAQQKLISHSLNLFENISRFDSITPSSFYGRKLMIHDLEELEKDKLFMTLLNTKLTDTQYEYSFSYTQAMRSLTGLLNAINQEIIRLEK